MGDKNLESFIREGKQLLATHETALLLRVAARVNCTVSHPVPVTIPPPPVPAGTGSAPGLQSGQ